MRRRAWMVLMMTAATAMGQGGVPPGNVSLTLEEYNRLIEAASKAPKRLDLPPLDYTIQSAGLKLRVEGETVTGTVQLEGEVLQKGLLKAPLVTGMTILDAKQNGSPLPLVQEGGTHSAVLAGPADFSISLQAGLPLAMEAGRASFLLPAPAAGTVRMELTVPGEYTWVNVSPGLITERGSNGGKTTVQATLVPGKPATVSWASRMAPVPVAAPKEVRLLSDVKTLVSVGEADITLSSLAEITVVQGDPLQFDLQSPAGYELTGATGATLIASEVHGQTVTLKVADASARSHQFLVSMVSTAAGAKAELALPGFAGSQRETGEVLVEGEGTMELAAAERGGLRRMDVKEGSAQLRQLARYPVHTAFRYIKKAGETPGVAMEWTRFPDTPVLAAVAQRAEVTTLVTTEGRSLTEVKLTVRNQSQQFLKVALPPGAQILSADVAGVKVKPLTGTDGERVPLLRQGFRPSGPYLVSFVFVHSGAPFAKKGGSELALPKMDVPVELVAWEVFLPKQYRVAEFGGDAVPARLLAIVEDGEDPPADTRVLFLNEKFRLADGNRLDSLTAGQMGGYVVDASGASVAGANVTVTFVATRATLRARTDASGRWLVASQQSGPVKIRVDAPGFQSVVRDFNHEASQPGRYSFRLNMGSVNETVEVSASAAAKQSQQIEREARQNAPAKKDKEEDASVNVADLQKRVVGVLPIAVDVPRAGNSYHFVRPLVVDEETKVTFNYRIGK